MVILGLTGSIGMGKSVAADMFRRQGAAVFDADAAVHRFLDCGGAAVSTVEAAFSGSAEKTPSGPRINRAALARRIMGDRTAMQRLEDILHPLVRNAETQFLSSATARRAKLIVLDVPLLYETGGDRRCDAVAVVWAPPCVQAQRVLRRPGMTPALLAAIRARQMPAKDKLRRADFTIPTGVGRAAALRHVRRIVKILSHRRGRKWPKRPRPYV